MRSRRPYVHVLFASPALGAQVSRVTVEGCRTARYRLVGRESARVRPKVETRPRARPGPKLE
eukprot:5425189-Prymnesium_polylepis.1